MRILAGAVGDRAALPRPRFQLPAPRTVTQYVSGLGVDLTFAVVKYNLQSTISTAVNVQLGGVQHIPMVVQS